MEQVKIKTIKRETEDSVVISFNIPEEITQMFDHKAGQYITVVKNINGEEVRRAYSICSAPHDPTIDIGVKKVEGGKMSSYLVDELQEGDGIDLLVPEGRFVVRADHDKLRDHYFIAAGSGITPILSMIKSLLEEEPQSTCYLLYGCRNEDSIMFKADLEKLIGLYKDQLYVEYILSQPKTEKKKGISGLLGRSSVFWTGMTGRITTEKVKNFIDSYPGEELIKEYYICGPGNMIEDISKYLVSLDIDKKKIHREYFSSPEQSSSKSVSIKNTNGLKHLIVHLNKEKLDLEISPDVTIVAALIDQGKEVPYSCTSGACSTCIAKLTKGEVKMEACFALDDDEIAQGYILTCQARVISDSATVEFDS